MKQLLHAQYEAVKGARLALFTYCAGMDSAHLLEGISTFNNSSIIYLLVHSANTYLHWVVFFDTQQPVDYFKEENISNLDDIKAIYQKVDEHVATFLNKYQADYTRAISKYPRTKVTLINTTPLELFTHAITHEFHHKGQMMTMSRLLGYTPADTDVIRF